MRIFVAGATGALGRPTVRLLAARGHELVGLTRTDSGRAVLESLGARAVVGDALNRAQLAAHVADARPDVVLHLLTALPPNGPVRAKDLEPTNVLRTVGTAHLIDAAISA